LRKEGRGGGQKGEGETIAPRHISSRIQQTLNITSLPIEEL